jgi:ankyrin repeat protein
VSSNKLAHDDVQDKAPRLDGMDVPDSVEAVAARLSAATDEPVTEEAGTKSAVTGSPNGIRSSPPTLTEDVAMDLDPPITSPEDGGVKSDSEAETIVLPGKDGHSPSKVRRSKSIKHEDKSDDEEMTNAPDVQNTKLEVNAADKAGAGQSTTSTAPSMLGKRKRPKHGNNNDDIAHLGNSSGLSSVPTSPVATTRSSLSKPAASDSDISKSPSPRPRSAVRDKAKSVDRVPLRKRHYTSASGDEAEVEVRRFGRQRSSGADHKSNRDARSLSKPDQDNNAQKRTGSISPQSRGHRRSISTQLPSKSSHGLSHKKKRVPAPLQSTEYHSDDSSASGSSHPRSSRLRSLAAPTTGESTMSPAKKDGSHKKHVNSSGQTRLAQACARGNLDIVRQRFEERPEDLNDPDHAGNTPLHAASISGYDDVVKFLLDNNCVVDPVNSAKETPLHDAIDNGHVEVVKLLLGAGANPNKPNQAGNEPLDLINEDKLDDEDAAEIRVALMEAKQKISGARRESEDELRQDNTESRLSHPTESPRHTPPIQAQESHSLGPTHRRVGTSRSIRTRDTNLFQPLNVTELRRAAREGDLEATSRVLSVMENLDDAKSLFLAARGGHADVINLLFAIGNFTPDPPPLEDRTLEFSTPILAAIGKDNHLQVIELFLGNAKFNPTRLTNGETYFEIARRRKGPQWEQEETLLKEAFDNWKKSHKASPGKPRSPGLRRDRRDVDQDAKRVVRKDEHQPSRFHKRSTSSPKAKEFESSKSQHRTNSSLSQSKDGQPVKRGPGRPRKEESVASAAISDRESSPLGPPKAKSQPRRPESDVAVVSETETAVKPRRKLVSGKEYRGERELEKQRRASVASNASSASVKDKRERGSADTKSDKLDGRASPTIPRVPKQNEHDYTSEKHTFDKDRARSLKRDDSKDRLSAIRGESPVKRPRKSETPPRSNMQEPPGYGASGGPPKRRKMEGDVVTGRRRDSTPSSSPEHHAAKPKSSLSHENSTAKSFSDTTGKPSRPGKSHSDHPHEISKSSNSGNQPSQARRATSPTSEHLPGDQKATSGSEPADITAGSIKSEKDEAAREAAKEAAKEAAREAAREVQIQREKEEREAREKREEEEKRELARIEQAKQARLAREQAAREEEEKRQREEAERKERQRLEDAEAHNRAMEEQRALYLEQERLKKEEQERRRAAALEQQRAERARLEEEREKARLSKLPYLLRWIDPVDSKNAECANYFRSINGWRYDTINPEAGGQANAREQWMLNTHVAILLGEKDLQLSRCKRLNLE